MNEIKCPKCGTVFQINEQDYDSIIKQIRDHEFERQIKEREKLFEIDKENAIKLSKSELDNKYQLELSKKNEELTKLKSDIEAKEKTKENDLKSIKIESEKKYQDEINKLNLKIKDLENEVKIKDNEKEKELKKIKTSMS